MTPSTKKHITSACLNCRRRKVKCDGASPCSNCVNSKGTCEYNAQADLRKLSAKKVIASLEARLAQLENTLSEHNIEHPPSTPLEDDDRSSPQDHAQLELFSQSSPEDVSIQAHHAALEDSIVHAGEAGIVDQESGLTESPSFTATDEISGAKTAASISIPGMLPTDSTTVDPIEGQAPHSQQIPSTNMFIDSTIQVVPPWASDTGLGVRSEKSGPSDSHDDDDITNMLSARMGSLRIAEDGQLRYYGPTSNLHLDPSGAHSLSHASIRSVAVEGHGVLDRLGLAQSVSPVLETHLARLYFTWEDPAIHVLDEDIFFEEKEAYQATGESSPYYSDTLNNAICAIGAGLATHDDIDLPPHASTFFSARAKALLDIEMDSPTVATVQALVIMSASEAASTRDSRGWLYSGMAARLSADLGLHLDMSHHLKAGTLSNRDLHIRQTAFWGVYIHENMWSSYVGRPGSMAVLNITVPRPSSYLDSVQSRTWKPYPVASIRGIGLEQGLEYPIQECTAANTTLVDFVRRINTHLYSGHQYSSTVLFQFLGQTSQELETWLQGLPESLRIDTADETKVYLPMVLQLHMQYYAVLITLYRPYISSFFQRNQDSVTDATHRLALNEAGKRCVAAAHRVTAHLRIYKRLYTLKRTNVQIIHVIFTVALMLIHDVCIRSSSSSRQSLKELQLCCHALSEIGQYFSSATRALETTIVVKGKFQRQAAAKQAAARKAAAAAGTKRRTGPTMGDSQSSSAPEEKLERNKKRQFSSVSEQGPFRIPDYSMPAVFATPMSFQESNVPWMAGFPTLQQQPEFRFEDLQGFGLQDFNMDTAAPEDWFNVPQSLPDTGRLSNQGDMLGM